MAEAQTTTTNPNEPRFTIQRVAIKESSFKSHKPHEILNSEWKPEANIELKINHTPLENNLIEVTLNMTVTMQSNKKLAFISEITQAGIFEMANFDEKQRDQLLNAYCPSVIYPFLRESVAHAVTQAGFPQLLISPINFDAMYAQQLAEKEKATAEKEEEPVTIN